MALADAGLARLGHRPRQRPRHLDAPQRQRRGRGHRQGVRSPARCRSRRARASPATSSAPPVRSRRWPRSLAVDRGIVPPTANHARTDLPVDVVAGEARHDRAGARRVDVVRLRRPQRGPRARPGLMAAVAVVRVAAPCPRPARSAVAAPAPSRPGSACPPWLPVDRSGRLVPRQPDDRRRPPSADVIARTVRSRGRGRACPSSACSARPGWAPAAGVDALCGWGEVARALAGASGLVPTVLVVDGPCLGGPALLLGLADVVVMTARGPGVRQRAGHLGPHHGLGRARRRPRRRLVGPRRPHRRRRRRRRRPRRGPRPGGRPARPPARQHRRAPPPRDVRRPRRPAQPRAAAAPSPPTGAPPTTCAT